MVPTIERHKGKLQTERIQTSHEFPNASNHSTHCWLTLDIHGDKTHWLTKQQTQPLPICTRDSENRTRG